jgi:hypothetical protein
VDPVSSGNNLEACGLSGAVSTPPGPQVNLTANPTDAFTGDTITLTWTVDGGGIPIDRCVASNDGSVGNWNNNVTPGNGSQSGVGPLDSASTYNFTLKCYNIYNVPGQDTAQVNVTVKPVPPTVVTTDVDGFGPPNATGRGTVNPNGFNVTECYLEWGPGGVGSPFPNRSDCSALPGSGTTPVGVQGYMSGLAGLSVYHYRVVATNSAGTGYGLDKCFKMNVADGGGGGMNLCNVTPPTPPPGGGGSCPNPSGGGDGNQDPCVQYFSASRNGDGSVSFVWRADHCAGGVSISYNGGSLGYGGYDGNGADPATATIGNPGNSSSGVTIQCNGEGWSYATASYDAYSGGGGDGGGDGGSCTPVPGCPPICGGADTCPPAGPQVIDHWHGDCDAGDTQMFRWTYYDYPPYGGLHSGAEDNDVYTDSKLWCI